MKTNNVNNYPGSISGQMNRAHATLDSIIKKANITGTLMDMINQILNKVPGNKTITRNNSMKQDRFQRFSFFIFV